MRAKTAKAAAEVNANSCVYIGCSDVTESMVTKLPPFCGYNMTRCVELVGADVLRYSNRIESVSYTHLTLPTTPYV